MDEPAPAQRRRAPVVRKHEFAANWVAFSARSRASFFLQAEPFAKLRVLCRRLYPIRTLHWGPGSSLPAPSLALGPPAPFNSLREKDGVAFQTIGADACLH